MKSSETDAALGLFRAGRVAEAEAALRARLAGAAADADAMQLLGYILAVTGRVAEGLPLLDRSIEISPRNPGFLNNRASALAIAGRLDEAERDLRRAVALEPRFLDGWLALGGVLRRLARPQEAMAAIGKVLAGEPDHPGANFHAGMLRLDARDLQGAAASFRRTLAREPRNSAAHNHLGIALREAGREDEAIASFESAAACAPREPEPLNNLGLALHQAGRSEEAVRVFERAVAMRPDFAEAHLNWGNLLRDQGDLEGARARFAEALAARPGFPEALSNAAGVALEMERLEEARAGYLRAAQLGPQLANPAFGLAQVLLREQRFEEGWDGYERRFETDPPLAHARSLPMPPLTRESLAHARRVAVWPEQGIGDQILFSTLLPELERCGIGAVVEVDTRLAPMYRRSLPGVEFVTREQSGSAFATCDHHIPLGSLPGLFRRDVAKFEGQPRALLKPDPGRIKEISLSLGRGSGRGLVIAISWRSPQAGSRRALGSRKSIPLEAFARLAEVTGARLVDLQYGDVAEERRQFEARHPGILLAVEGLDAFSDLEGVAAALAACGRLVTSSNAIAHLAGALGVPTRLLCLRGWAPFSYWVPGRDGRSLWYPSVEVLCDRHSWHDAMDRAALEWAPHAE